MTTQQREQQADSFIERLALIGEPACTAVSSGAVSVETLAAEARAYREIDLRDVLEEIVDAWRKNGSPAPEAAAPTAHLCAVNACRALPFVRLKTAGGPRSVCHEHWVEIDASR